MDPTGKILLLDNAQRSMIEDRTAASVADRIIAAFSPLVHLRGSPPSHSHNNTSSIFMRVDFEPFTDQEAASLILKLNPGLCKEIKSGILSLTT